MPEVELLIDGVRHGGWKSVRITRSIEQLASTFEIELTERWTEREGPAPIREGAACELLVAPRPGDSLEPVLRGYIDEITREYDAQNRRMSASGRSKTGDLVDCTAIADPGQWRDRTLAQIAVDLCAPFGIEVTDEARVLRRFASYSIQQGETVHECLERAARKRGVLLLSDVRGDLVLARPQGQIIHQALGGTLVLSGGRTGNVSERFSRYTVKGQNAGDDDTSGAAAAAVQGAADDPDVGRYRPLTIMGEHGDRLDAGTRAQWERDVRRARSLRLRYRVQGWSHSDGLWAPGQNVLVRDARLDVDEDLLITEATLRLDAQGTVTELSLMAPEAFEVAAGVAVCPRR